MEEQKKKQSPNPLSVYILIAIGLLGVYLELSGKPTWSTIFTIKLLIDVGVIGCGILLLTRKKVK